MSYLEIQAREDEEIGRAIRKAPSNIEIHFYPEDGDYRVILSERKYGCWMKQGRGDTLRLAFIDAGLIDGKVVTIEQGGDR